MANPDRPMGFRPAKSLLSAPWQALVRRYPAADRSADTTNNHGDIYIGDPVKFSSGLVLPANSGDTVVGVAVAFDVLPAGTMMADVGSIGADPTDLMRQYLPHTIATGAYVFVVPVEGVLFEIQSASDLDLVAGSLADFNLVAGTAHGSRTTGQSNVELVVALDNDVRVVEVSTYPDNDSTLANTRYLVKFQIPQFPV